jgi:serine/threonine protein kinase
MGVVFLAHDEQLDRDVAVKVLPLGTLQDESARRRFRREALALARLNHPNIETIHEFGSQDGMDFLVTESNVGNDVGTDPAFTSLRSDPRYASLLQRLAIEFARASESGGAVTTNVSASECLQLGFGKHRSKAENLGMTERESRACFKILNRGYSQTTPGAGGRHSCVLAYARVDAPSGLCFCVILGKAIPARKEKSEPQRVQQWQNSFTCGG